MEGRGSVRLQGEQKVVYGAGKDRNSQRQDSRAGCDSGTDPQEGH